MTEPEPKLAVNHPPDVQTEIRLLRERVSDLEDGMERVDKLEKWQAFVFGAAAATGAFVGVGLTLASLLLDGK